jgi:uncharacterized protein YjbI with pentapeptide repeats
MESDAKPITRRDLAAAAEKGEPVIGRLIQGRDVAAVLAGHLAPTGSCVPHAGLRIQKSVIKGEIKLESKLVRGNANDKGSPAQAADDDDDEASSGDDDKRPEKWLSIPWSVTDSTVSDPVLLRSIGLGCMLDVSRSAFKELVQFNNTTFMGDVMAEASDFQSGMGAQNANFKGSVVFRRAKLAKNFESVAGRFEKNVDFRDATFGRLASFIGSRFLSRMDFRYAQFAAGANFSGAALGGGPAASFSGPFYMAEFGGLANFRRAHFKQLRFLRTTFRNGADFNAARGKSLLLYGVALSGRFALDGRAAVEDVQLDGWGGSMVVDGDAVFRGATIDKLTLRRMAFKRIVDFQGVSIKSKALIQTVSFEGDLRLEDGLLPGTQQTVEAAADDEEPDAGTAKVNSAQDQSAKDPTAKEKADEETPAPKKSAEITVRDITLSKGFYIDRDQFFAEQPWWAFWRENRPRFLPDHNDAESDEPVKEQRRMWRELGSAFELAKNVELKNYAEFRGRRFEEDDDKGVSKIAAMASRWFWGYGVRPMRALLWFGLLVLAFAAIYWTQLRHLATTSLERARHALIFSIRTASELKYGYDHSATAVFRAITIAESVLAKLTLTLFVYALTQTNPLLSELTKKLLP